MDKANVEKAVLLAVDIGPTYIMNGYLEDKIYQAFRFTTISNLPQLILEAKRFLEFANTPNDTVLEFVSKYPKRLIGFGSISPLRREKEITEHFKYLVENGFKGLKTIPTLQFYDPQKSKNAELIWKKAEEENFIILAHTGFDPGPWEYFPLSIVARPSRYEKLIKKYETPLIFAHAGSYSAYYPTIWHRECIELVRKYDHVYMDISAVFYLTRDEHIVELWREYSIMDKILFGSDYPAVEGMSIEDSVDIVRNSSVLTQKEKLLILRINAEKLIL